MCTFCASAGVSGERKTKLKPLVSYENAKIHVAAVRLNLDF